MKLKRYVMAATATLGFAVAAHAAGETVLASASREVSLDLTAGARAGTTLAALPSMTYSGTSWASSTGGSATVIAVRSGSNAVYAPVNGKAGEGFFSFTPTAAGTWTFTHTGADGKSATATFTVTGDAAAGDGEVLAVASGEVSLDLAAGTRELADGESAAGLTYSGTGWTASTGGAATVTARQDGASYEMSVLEGASGEGTFTFVPAAGGVWTLTHTDANGGTVTARFAAPTAGGEGGEEGGETGYEYVLVGAASGEVELDLVTGTRDIDQADDLKPIVYSGNGWTLTDADGDVTLTFTPDGAGETVTVAKAGEGEYDFDPDAAGLWTAVHASDAGTLTATFRISENALLGTLANPYDVMSQDEFDAVGKDGKFVRLPAGTTVMLDEPRTLVAFDNGVYQILGEELVGADYVDSAEGVQIVAFESGIDEDDTPFWWVGFKLSLVEKYDKYVAYLADWTERSARAEKIGVVSGDDLSKLGVDALGWEAHVETTLEIGESNEVLWLKFKPGDSEATARFLKVRIEE